LVYGERERERRRRRRGMSDAAEHNVNFYGVLGFDAEVFLDAKDT
jgi:hypothetical protein